MQVEFNNLPIGQKFMESCCSGTTFTKAVKVSETEIEKMDVDAHDFAASCEVKVFNPEFDWLEPVAEFKDVNGKVKTFEYLKKLFGC
jgi:hypothetical protein